MMFTCAQKKQFWESRKCCGYKCVLCSENQWRCL